MTFVKGISGNPDGRPPHAPLITPLVRKYLDLNMKELRLEKLRDDLPIKDHAAMNIAELLKKGDHRTLSTIWDRMDGKVKEQVDVTSGGQPIPIIAINAIQRNDSDQKDNIAK